MHASTAGYYDNKPGYHAESTCTWLPRSVGTVTTGTSTHVAAFLVYTHLVIKTTMPSSATLIDICQSQRHKSSLKDNTQYQTVSGWLSR